MKKYEVLYDWAVEEITRLSDSQVAEDYAGSLAGTAEDDFIALSERLRLIGPQLAEAKASRALYGKWLEIADVLGCFERQFPSFPSPAFRKFRLFVQVANRLLPHASDVDLNDGDIDVALFEIRELQEPVPMAWFSKENRTRFGDSLVIFDFGSFAPPEEGEAE
ncbi:MAG: hypothetical protein EOP06_06905, partial [Proteobacteria bacterium]